MKTIFIEVSDGQFWHKDEVELQLIKELSNGQPIFVNLKSEGACATEIGLYSFLDRICDFCQVDTRLITLDTNNLLEKSDRYNIIKRSSFIKGLDTLVNTCQNWPFKTINKDTKHFGSFVGRGNRMRLAISSYLFYHQRNKTLLSYHTDVTNPYFNEFIGLEELMFHKYESALIDDSFNFLKACPIKLDLVTQYPIKVVNPETNNIINRYPEIFLEIVYKPFCLGNTFFADEKLWRAIGTKTPFIVQGPRYFLQNLKKLGFKTFDRWWNEGYSEDPPDYQVNGIIDNVKIISSWDTSKLINVYEEMKPTLEHNHKLLMSLTIEDFKRIFDCV